jgi:hypothetical protein
MRFCLKFIGAHWNQPIDVDWHLPIVQKTLVVRMVEGEVKFQQILRDFYLNSAVESTSGDQRVSTMTRAGSKKKTQTPCPVVPKWKCRAESKRAARDQRVTNGQTPCPFDPPSQIRLQ